MPLKWQSTRHVNCPEKTIPTASVSDALSGKILMATYCCVRPPGFNEELAKYTEKWDASQALLNKQCCDTK